MAVLSVTSSAMTRQRHDAHADDLASLLRCDVREHEVFFRLESAWEVNKDDFLLIPFSWSFLIDAFYEWG